MPAVRLHCGDRAVLRALHFINENKRVLVQTEALKNHDLETFFKLVKESGDSSFKFLQNVYTTKNVQEQGLSLALELAEEYLARMSVPCACRVHGGGFAGTIQAFVPAPYAQGFAALMELLFGDGRCHILHVRSEGAICII
jgi:galactokinase